MRKQTWVPWAFSLMAGCASSQAEQVRDAHMEAANARTSASDQSIDANEKAEKGAIDQSYDAQKQNIEHSGDPGANGSEKLVGIAKDRAEYQAKAQARLDKEAVRINETQQKLNVLGPRAPESLRGGLRTATSEYQMIKQDVLNLNSTAPTDWEGTTKRIEDRMGSLDARLDALNKSIESV